MSNPPSFEYRETQSLYLRDQIAAKDAQLNRDRAIRRSIRALAALTLTAMVAGMSNDALSDTTRYENGLVCSGSVDLVVSGSEKLIDVAERDVLRLGISAESTNKLLTMYMRENSPFTFTYDEENTMFIRQDVATITSAESCAD